LGREVLSPVALTSLVSRIVSSSTRLSVKETGLVPVVFVSESDKMLVTFTFGIGERVTIVIPIFFYHNSAESLPRLGLGRVVTPSAFSQVIQSRVTSFSNVKDDLSAKDRANLYGRTLNLALSEVIGKGNGTLEPIDSGIIELLLTLGWMGAIPYISGLVLSFYSLFQASKSNSDPFASAARAIVVGFLPMLAGSNVIAGISGMVFWGFLGIGMAAIKYHQHQRRA